MTDGDLGEGVCVSLIGWWRGIGDRGLMEPRSEAGGKMLNETAGEDAWT